MIKNEKGISLVKIIFIIALSLTVVMLITILLVGEKGLINQFKEQFNKKETNYVIRVDENQ